MAAVDRVMRKALDSEVVLIRQVAEYIVAGGGKRLRPALLLLTAGATGYRGTDHHVLAAVIEMIHTATLLHDDVVDESDMRRGHATANAQFGNAASVLVGDFLYSRAFQMMVGQGRIRVLRDPVRCDQRHRRRRSAAAHERRQHRPHRAHLPRSDPAQDRQAVRGGRAAGRRVGRCLRRTAKMRWPATACTSAPRSSWSTTSSTIRAASESIGKSLGDDLAEGKMTLPLIRAMTTGSADDAALIRHAIAGGGLTDFAPVVSALERTGALAYAKTCAEGEVRRAAVVPGGARRFCVPAKSARIDDLRGATNVLNLPTVPAARFPRVAPCFVPPRNSPVSTIRGVA